MDVLVVEDNEAVAESLTFLLDCYNHRATAAHDGEAALRVLRAQPFQLVLLDENLPGLKGSAVARSIIDMRVFDRPFIVPMTGDSDGSLESPQLFMSVCTSRFPWKR
ncbi:MULTISPECIES: response regulator [Paraburkholderia]|jgi:DNA-binding response OmpR family regulator|uniref:DNA-binding response OmpR family regulator n=1 Tax=Paraburkholderia fungorum TaxID=134537 RepID=A0AAW3UXR9_9BURK|nr:MULTISPECIES: response regulator [Paraburkholderia]MBB4515491.1 DNA-binding response OmpR family regulator [Paraburkholderia fungorum]MBB6203434.1 DNA-binding response OmpR family regulator [Paraburkholderia fungorum]USX07379.1 response regulator [Paraburkholderia fungorum]